jgi:hypothetical protein
VLRATADGKDGPIVMLGLSAENIKRLKADQPISVPAGGDLGLNKRVVIFYGESEAQMLNQMRPAIGPNTKAHVDPRLGES